MAITLGNGHTLTTEYPTKFMHGTVSGNTYTNVGSADLEIRATALDTNNFYIDYLVPISYLDSTSKYIAYDPIVKDDAAGSGTGGSAASVTVSMMSAMLSFAAAMFVWM